MPKGAGKRRRPYGHLGRTQRAECGVLGEHEKKVC